MFSSREAFENDFCPVRDELLGEMYRASEHGLPQLVESVSPDVRAMLALFCYRKSHLHSLALAIAASCTELELVQAGGRVGQPFGRMPPEIREAVIEQEIEKAEDLPAGNRSRTRERERPANPRENGGKTCDRR